MKKLIALLCALLLLGCTFAAAEATVLSAGEFDPNEHEVPPLTAGKYVYIVLNDGTAEIVNYKGDVAELTVPKKLGGIAVTSISCSAFNYNTNLTSVTIPEGVTFIGNDAFYGCRNLTTVNLPSTLVTLGEDAFNGCSALVNITLPEGLTTIGESAFEYCSALTTIVFPESLTFIGKEAFYNCDLLANFAIPANVTAIDEYAFYSCDALTDIVLPDTLTSIGTNAFDGCYDLILTVNYGTAAEQYVLDDNVQFVYTSIEPWACPECTTMNNTEYCTECGAEVPAA